MSTNIADDSRADTLVTGSSGVIGRRVVTRLEELGVAFRGASRSGRLPFDWTDPGTWEASLAGIRRLILIVPEGVPVHPDFLPTAAAAGLEQVVLLSDRGAEVMQVERLLEAERLVTHSGLPWTIVRPDWFNQNFSESFFLPGVLDGLITVPIGEVRQTFVDADDIAAVLAQTLIDPSHAGRTYELSGPSALSFAEAVKIIGNACGRQVRFAGDADSYRRGQVELGDDPAQTRRELDRFARLAAQGDATPTGDVQRVLARPPIPFTAFVQGAAAAWR